eukprot:gene9574-12283_t
MSSRATTGGSPPYLDWVLVAGHYPIYSRGPHGDTDELVTYLWPLLLEFGVDAYICGHDHISEHLRDNYMEHFVVGAGSMTDSLGTVPSVASLLWSGTGYSAFGAMSAKKESLTIQYVNMNGDIVYNYTMLSTHADVQRRRR